MLPSISRCSRRCDAIGTWRPLLARLLTTKHGKQVSASKRDQEMFINPLDLTEDNVSQIYCVPTEDVKTAFPTSLPRRFTAQVDAFGHTCWLLRRQSYEIMKELREYDSTQPQMFRYLLYGSDGSGKTLCLHQVLHHCLKAGWLVVFIPSGVSQGPGLAQVTSLLVIISLLSSLSPLLPLSPPPSLPSPLLPLSLVFSWTHSRQELRPSAHHPGTFDQPEAAVTWLKTFRTLNSHLTAQMHISRDWEWGKKDYSSAGEDLNNVIDKGLLKPVIATEVVSAVLQELVLASDRLKMVLAVDEFNGCFNPTTLKTPQKEWVVPEQLNLVRAILRHVPQFPGALLLSLSRTRMFRCSAKGWMPDDLLIRGAVSSDSGAVSQAVLNSCQAVEVPPYTRHEMEKCLDYYSQRQWVNTELSPAVVNELWHLSSGSPHVLHKLCASL